MRKFCIIPDCVCFYSEALSGSQTPRGQEVTPHSLSANELSQSRWLPLLLTPGMHLSQPPRCSGKAIPLPKPQSSPCRKLEKVARRSADSSGPREGVDSCSFKADPRVTNKEGGGSSSHLDSPSTLVTVLSERNVSLE